VLTYPALRTSLLLGLFTLPVACGSKPPPAPPLAAAGPVVPAGPRAVAIEPVGDVTTGSTVALGKVRGHTLAFVADEDGPAIDVIDTETMRQVATAKLTGRPGQILVTRTGKLWVTLRDEASVAVFEARDDQSLARSATVPTTIEPLALAPSTGNAILVASGWAHTLERFDAATLTRDLRVNLPREPRAVIASRDGARAFVAHAAHGGVTSVPLEGPADASDIDLGKAASASSAMTSTPMMPMKPPPPSKRALKMRPDFFVDEDMGNGFMVQIPARFARQGFALASYQAKSGESILAPHAEMITGDPKIISSGYGGGGVSDAEMSTEQFAVSAIDPATSKQVTSGAAAHQCRLPRAAVVVGGEKLLVACLGGDEVAAFSTAAPGTYLGSAKVAAGPTGLAVDADGRNAYVFSQFDGTVTEVPLASILAPRVVSRGNAAPANDSVGGQAPPPARSLRLDRTSALGELAERGRKIFHAGGDARISKDGRACASCHPDGRDDGLVWSTPNGPRQTILLAGRVRHEAPYGWMAKHASLQEHMRSTMKNLKGKGLEKADEDALASYLTSMPGPPAVARPLTPEEERGRAVFASKDTDCATCHGGTDKSDHDLHDVKSLTASDKSRELIAPSLVDVAGSAPYFHDGRYSSLEDLLDKTNGSMGSTATLSPEDKGALVAYLRTL